MGGRTFAAEGARLAIADVAPMDTVVAEVEALRAEVLPVRTDVGVEDDARSLLSRCTGGTGASTCSSTALERALRHREIIGA